MELNTSGIRSPFSPRVRQSLTGRRPIGLPSVKKNQSKFMLGYGGQTGEVIYKTPQNTVETYGMPLPVMVTETLTFASGEVTARLSQCGWCWVVTGRKVLTWPFERPIPSGGSSPAPPAPPPARELTLPQTDLAHKADLVVVFYDEGAQMPSCIGVSPEGTVRYWPSVGQEGVYVDVSAELGGQECERLAGPSSHGLLLATTTCTLVLLTLLTVDGRATVACRTLRPPSGWLGGIGRRVSLLFFGSMPAQVDAKLVGVVPLEGPVLEAGAAAGCAALVGAGGALQLRGYRDELLLHELRRALRERAQGLRPGLGDMSSLELVAVDVQARGASRLLLLLAVLSVTSKQPTGRYAVAEISVEEPAAPSVERMSVFRIAARDEFTAPRFVPHGDSYLVYTQNYVAVVPTSSATDKADVIDVASCGDRVLGCSLCGDVPLLFTRKHGVAAITASAHALSASGSALGSPCPSDVYDGNLSLYEIDPHEVSQISVDACGKLKSAFLFHLRRETAACGALVRELFPAPPAAAAPPRPASPQYARDEMSTLEERDVDSVLDRTVVKIATEMLDDIPVGDPRWKQSSTNVLTNIPLGSSSALQITSQLRDKQRAFNLFVQFLMQTGLWARLTTLSREEGGGCISTQAALCALSERLVAALALRSVPPGPEAQLVEAAIYQVVCGENAEFEHDPSVLESLRSGVLSAPCVFYCRVSRVHRAMACLARHGARDRAQAAAAMAVLAHVLGEVQKHRSVSNTHAHIDARLPALTHACVDLVKQAVLDTAGSGEPAGASLVLSGASSLADLLLTDAQRVAHAAPHVFEAVRRDTIQPFVDAGQTELALALAEKYKEFNLLIAVCVRGDDLPRLHAYIDKYAAEGLAETTFAWLASRGGRERVLLLRSLGARYPAALSAWLAAAERPTLRALHLQAERRHDQAARVLARLATEETASVNRMKTMASLAKLCLIASDSADAPLQVDTWRQVDSCLALAEQHAALPRDLRVHHGVDSADCRVLPPEQLVQMYIESESASLSEYDYKKALDLTDFVQDMELRDELRLRVWCAALRRDDWSMCRVDAPQEALHDKMFFRLVELVQLMGGDLELLLPPLDDVLTAPELAELVSDPRFHFIIKYGYETLDAGDPDQMSDE